MLYLCQDRGGTRPLRMSRDRLERGNVASIGWPWSVQSQRPGWRVSARGLGRVLYWLQQGCDGSTLAVRWWFRLRFYPARGRENQPWQQCLLGASHCIPGAWHTVPFTQALPSSPLPSLGSLHASILLRALPSLLHLSPSLHHSVSLDARERASLNPLIR